MTKKATETKEKEVKTSASGLMVKVRATLLEPMLGTWPTNQELARDFIASKSPDASTIEEEIAALGVDAVAEKGMTVFPRNADNAPVIYDYQIKGFFKDACSMLARVKGTKSSGIKAYKKIIDGLIFPQPRMIEINMNGEMGNSQRPLRAQTPQGERVSLANSEEVPAGSWFEFDVWLLDGTHFSLLEEWLRYGAVRGLGQWRNSGKGRFSYEILATEQQDY